MIIYLYDLEHAGRQHLQGVQGVLSEGMPWPCGGGIEKTLCELVTVSGILCKQCLTASLDASGTCASHNVMSVHARTSVIHSRNSWH